MNGRVFTKSPVKIAPKVTSVKLAGLLTSVLENISLLCGRVTLEMLALSIFLTLRMTLIGVMQNSSIAKMIGTAD